MPGVPIHCLEDQSTKFHDPEHHFMLWNAEIRESTNPLSGALKFLPQTGSNKSTNAMYKYYCNAPSVTRTYK